MPCKSLSRHFFEAKFLLQYKVQYFSHFNGNVLSYFINCEYFNNALPYGLAWWPCFMALLYGLSLWPFFMAFLWPCFMALLYGLSFWPCALVLYCTLFLRPNCASLNYKSSIYCGLFDKNWIIAVLKCCWVKEWVSFPKRFMASLIRIIDLQWKFYRYNSQRKPIICLK